ncbi:DUF5074 domain-containing protein [Arachidicoccus soli]|uniref:YncE family protein n=1 Tax=Arachidicoccus soli TaxID=2341117 RepID=A0A386HQI0_9BACT|nr:DUF5074 domain-containing protein [Arachidicoccus soli]AYD47836.1 YncE family protein [Arachidicoccus soli]
MKKQEYLLVLAAAIIGGFAACTKNDAPMKEPVEPTTGVYVLNQGGFGGNNTTLTYYDFATAKATADFFALNNSTSLGSTGNDAIIFGSKMYIVMNGSDNVTVVDKTSGKLIKRIAGPSKWSPREAMIYKNELLITAFNNTVSIIDTAALSITQTIIVGTNPEGMAISGNMLYVANSGGLNYVIHEDYDSTVSVVDLTSNTELKKIKVGLNPNYVVADSKGNIYVSTFGNYSTILPRIYKIDASSNTITDSSNTVNATGKMVIYDDNLYLEGTSVTTLSTTNLHGTPSNFITDNTIFKSPYGLDIDPSNGDVYVSDAIDYVAPGMEYCFDNTGKLKFSFSVAPGVNPYKVVFL